MITFFSLIITGKHSSFKMMSEKHLVLTFFKQNKRLGVVEQSKLCKIFTFSLNIKDISNLLPANIITFTLAIPHSSPDLKFYYERPQIVTRRSKLTYFIFVK